MPEAGHEDAVALRHECVVGEGVCAGTGGGGGVAVEEEVVEEGELGVCGGVGFDDDFVEMLEVGVGFWWVDFAC